MSDVEQPPDPTDPVWRPVWVAQCAAEGHPLNGNGRCYCGERAA